MRSYQVRGGWQWKSEFREVRFFRGRSMGCGPSRSTSSKTKKFGQGCIEQWQSGATAIRAEAAPLHSRFETTLLHSPFVFGDTPL